jgi:hypothetical protein
MLSTVFLLMKVDSRVSLWPLCNKLQRCDQPGSALHYGNANSVIDESHSAPDPRPSSPLPKTGGLNGWVAIGFLKLNDVAAQSHDELAPSHPSLPKAAARLSRPGLAFDHPGRSRSKRLRTDVFAPLAANDSSKDNYNLGSCTVCARRGVGQRLTSAL